MKGGTDPGGSNTLLIILVQQKRYIKCTGISREGFQSHFDDSISPLAERNREGEGNTQLYFS